MKGIILAGGTGTRLYPLTHAINKHLLPIYDKPLIYYPIATLMLANIREILIITRSEDVELYKSVLGHGQQWGLKIDYAIQDQPRGIAEAVIIGEKFINAEPFALILGDNLFFGHGFKSMLHEASQNRQGATIFCYWVVDPQRFGVAELDKYNQVISLEEKPQSPKSNYAVTGLYFYDAQAVEFAKQLKPSLRGELEITDLNRIYLEKGLLKSVNLHRGFAWLDTGTHESLMDAGNYIATIEKRQGLKVACLEEIAWRNNWITDMEFLSCYENNKGSSYGSYLKQIFHIGKGSDDSSIIEKIA
ncbi:glucose-1-phosphate thymidylyltransferase RfbA [Candidatus Odyssella thessalonicensis]|uniref:glucose-1-phosphate thymidylyltransferase RfbA n=1 Tax=Candidatus Odyssella thessalonicensis TaxID=84647 RepID=UPI000225B430|nr:glucose-1-phosphate thymidylyltransferase RfbA [Candidatus Odyssella thessalonicensis]